MGYKIEKLARKIQKDISDIVQRQMNDPRVGFISITRVDLSRDLKFAKVWVSILGQPNEQSKVMRALDHARGYVQSEVARRLRTRQTPILSFHQDKGIEQSIKISKILQDLLPADEGEKEETDEE